MNDLKDRTLTIERLFNAPIHLVWEAWTKPEHILKWWAPSGMPIKVLEHNFKEGGKWKYTMQMPNGSDFVSEGTYKEIVTQKKIITSADFKPMTQDVELQVYFEAEGEHTKFTFSVLHATPEYCQQQREMGFYNGWGSAFERLDKLLSIVD
ncbi:MAG: SRPBCC domain-containing protein [Bacteroidota bacterium]